MLSSLKLFISLLLLLLFATLTVQSVALQRREIQQHGNGIAIAAELIVTTMIPTPTPMPTSTALPTPLPAARPVGVKPEQMNKLTPSSTPSQPEKEKFEKNVKIIFPTTNDSEDESKFDVYGWKSTPKPKENPNIIVNTANTTDLPLVENETTTVPTIAIEVANTNNNTAATNSTIESVDDRLGILNLAPHCPEGHVVVNQRCHKSA